jgi:hypothetical protein
MRAETKESTKRTYKHCLMMLFNRLVMILFLILSTHSIHKKSIVPHNANYQFPKIPLPICIKAFTFKAQTSQSQSSIHSIISF